MLMMVLCDRWGRVYDVWITFGSVHEVRAFRERKKRSLWFRGLVENCVVYGDRGYRGCEGVIGCASKRCPAHSKDKVHGLGWNGGVKGSPLPPPLFLAFPWVSLSSPAF